MSAKTKKLTISIAEIPIEICGSQEHLDLISNEYPAFLCHSKPLFKVSIKDNPSFVCPDPEWYYKNDLLLIKLEAYRGIVVYGYLHSMGRIEMARKNAFLELGAVDRIRNFDLFLRALYANVLAYRDGALLHSATLIKDEKGYLFLGESGAGKTTVTKSVAGTCNILNDDMSVIRKVDGVCRVFGSPFFGSGKTPEMVPVNKSVPLKGMFQLAHAKANRLEKMSRKEAFFSLVCAMRLLPRHKPTYRRVANHLRACTEVVPAYKLYFTKQCDFWRLMP